MTRDITLQFDDGSSHQYKGVPDDVTPDQVTERAAKEFSGKKLTNIDGGKKPEPKKEETLLDKAKGVGEAALQMAGSMAAPFLAATAPGLLPQAEGESATEAASNAYHKGKELATYEPTTEKGKEYSENVGKVMKYPAKVIDLPGKAVEAVTGSKMSHEITTDFLPFVAGPAVKAGAGAAIKGGIELGDRAVQALKNDVPMSVKVADREKFSSGVVKAHEDASALGMDPEQKGQLTKGQLQAAGLRAIGKNEQAAKVLQREQELAKSHPEVADHFQYQARIINSALGDITSKLPEDAQAISEIKTKGIVRTTGDVITSVDTKKIANLIEKHRANLSSEVLSQLEKIRDTAKTMSLPDKLPKPSVLGKVGDVLADALQHKLGTAAKVGVVGGATAVGGPIAGAAAGAAELGAKALKDSIQARNITKTGKLTDFANGQELTKALREDFEREYQANPSITPNEKAFIETYGGQKMRSGEEGVWVNTTRSVMKQAFGEEAPNVLSTRPGKGLVRIIGEGDSTPTAKEFPNAKGAYVPGERGTGHVEIYANRVAPSEIPNLVMHELGEHYGMPRMLGLEKYGQVLNGIKTAFKRGDADVVNAWTTVKKLYPAEKFPEKSTHFLREVSARLAETSPENGLVRTMINSVRAWLYKEYGIGATVDKNLIQGLAQSALKSTIAGKLDSVIRDNKGNIISSETLNKEFPTIKANDFNKPSEGTLKKPLASIQNNASGESSASLEAQSRLKSEAAKGETRYKINTRTGEYTPLNTVDAVDTRARANEMVVKMGPNGKVEIIDQGSVEKNATEGAINRFKQKLEKDPVQVINKNIKEHTAGNPAGSQMERDYGEALKMTKADLAGIGRENFTSNKAYMDYATSLFKKHLENIRKKQ